MCRLLGVLGDPLTPVEPWLVSTDRSLLAQSNVSPEQAQRDGWGIGWYEQTRQPRLEKGIGGAFETSEANHFHRASQMARGPVVIGHLRHASNPMNLPKERLISLENSQPFAHGGLLFAHNGMIPYPRETRSRLGRFERNVVGVNDSEVLFWLFVRHVEEFGDPVQAYASVVRDLVEVWRERGSPVGGPYTGLNILVSRGPNELWAFCHWLGEHGGHFFDAKIPYYEMTYSADAKSAILGSEPFDSAAGRWHSIPNGSYLYAQSSHGLVAVRSGPISPDLPASTPVAPVA
jgi:predicted glutamine amidotransferase